MPLYLEETCRPSYILHDCLSHLWFADITNVAAGMELKKNAGNFSFHIKLGYEDYIHMGINPKKLVMGVPWYGYDYSCLSLSKVKLLSKHIFAVLWFWIVDSVVNPTNLFPMPEIVETRTWP